ncbi:InlB B-repeat-containing protein [Oscillibacter sp.]|uniref:InlB B-repeat-containing protein n=1 Tax=Oscillibacter sp. TaxID=1945593 RepID=UPI002D80589F|nr:InlB B-repeat-containing protein [Oscillibacter sp.]
MRKWMLGALSALALCLALLPGTAEAAETRTTRLELTGSEAENPAEGWSWKKADGDGYYYTLTLNNVNFEVSDDSAITFSVNKGGWLGGINIVLIGENRVVSTFQDDNNFYQTYGILLNTSSSYPPGEIVVTGGGSLTAEGYRSGIRLATNQLHFKGVTVNVQSAYPSGLLVTNDGSLLIEDSTVRANTISAKGLTASGSDISVVSDSLPAGWTYAVSLLAADGVDISGGSLTLSGPENDPAYCGVFNNAQTSVDLTDCRIDIRNVENGIHVNAGTINLANVQGTVLCSEPGTSLYSQNPAFHANNVNASGCSIYAQTGMNLFIYGDCALPEQLAEVTVPGDLILEAGKTFTIGEGQKVIFSKDLAKISTVDNTTLVNNGTLEFLKKPNFRSGTKLINNGTLIAPEGISYLNSAQVTNSGTFDGIVTENSGFTEYIYGNVTLGGRTLGGTGWMLRKLFLQENAILTIPNGKTVDASQEANDLTWETLSKYLSVEEGGKIVVEEGGQLLLPPNPTQEQLNSLPITGEGTVKAGDALVCAVHFDSQGGSEVRSYVTLSGETVSKPANPAKSGYVFGGWYTEASCETVWDFATGTVAGPLTLYAKWTPAPPPPAPKTYTVRFLDGGTELASLTVRQGSKAAPPEDPVKEGYRFDGWHTDAEGTNPFDFETAVTADLTLYAKWTALTPSRPDTPGGGSSGGSSSGGGGGSRPASSVAVEPPEHGTVTSDRSGAAYGAPVTLTVRPDGGYRLESLTVTDRRGIRMKLSELGGGKYAFTMPGGPVTVRAVFRAQAEEAGPSPAFSDLDAGAWYHEAVNFVLEKGLMNGYADGTFRPAGTLSRAMLAQILYNREGRPAVTGGKVFADVDPGGWCADAVAWAAERGVADGYDGGLFRPDAPITRQQLAVMLWRYAGSPAAADGSLDFTDADQAGDYALEALRWAVERGVMNGRGGGLLDPRGLATRAQTAQMLKNYLENA